MHQSFISYRSYRYAIWAAALSMAALVLYALHPARAPPGGGTWLGYTLGSIAALLVLHLAWYGVRRRSFRSSGASAQGWLSAHVYLGLAALVLATLHCGFQFGVNVHTAAYGLLLLVVASGCWGMYAYVRYPALIQRGRGNASREALIEELAQLDRRARLLSAPLSEPIRDLVDEAIRRTQLGGNVWQQLRDRDRSAIVVGQTAGAGQSLVVSNEGHHVLIERLARAHAEARNAEHAAMLRELLDLTGHRAVLVGRLQKDIQLQGLLQFWLFIHLPLCFGLLAALLIHVVAVFLYW